MVDRLLPDHLLKSSISKCLSYFRNEVIIQHRIAKKVLNDVMEIINCPGDKNTIFVVGPTGVGKSMLCKKIVSSVNSLYKDIIENPGIMPVIQLNASAPSEGNFRFKQLYKNILESAQEPLIAYKISSNGTKASEEAYAEAARSCIKNRNVKVVIIDEAQHMTKVTNTRKVLDQLETLKSFIDSTEAIFVLSGTYNLTSCFMPSGQVVRRSTISHFPRYRKECKNDGVQDVENKFVNEYDEFVNIIMNFELRIPIRRKPNFNEDYKFIYAKSLGCTGILKDWLYDALKKALNEGSETITKEHLEKTALETKRCLTIAREAIEGEQNLEDLMLGDNELYSLLQVNTDTQEIHNELNSNTNITPNKVNANKRPGKRNVNRDPVGMEVV